MNGTRKLIEIVAVVLLMVARPAAAVVFFFTGDTNYNTSAPTGSLADSGWQWVGFWGSFQAVPIDAHHFLAANHIGGSLSDSFTFHGAVYTTVRSFTDPASDLRIWEVRESFPAWAPLYRSGDEVGRMFIVFGRGVTRGAEVRTAVDVAGVPANSLAGWQYGNSDGRLRWGQNKVAMTRKHPTFGEQLYAAFDQSGGVNECHLGTGDSSGPVFINDGAGWKLAGVAGLVDASFNTTNAGAGFNACIYDSRGLYYGSSGSWKLVTTQTPPGPVPSGFYATRVSVRAAWIDSVLATPLTAAPSLSSLDQVYDGSPHEITVTTAPAGLTVAVTYAGASSVPANAGSYAVVATITATGYTGSASGILKIAPAPQSIRFGALSPVALGAAPCSISAIASSGLLVSFSSSNPGVATISGSTVTILAAGVSTITASQSGNANYLAAASVRRELIVSSTANGEIGAGADAPLFSGPLAFLFPILLAEPGIIFPQNPASDSRIW
jgi:hypothetical protein